MSTNVVLEAASGFVFLKSHLKFHEASLSKVLMSSYTLKTN